jgi:tRNA pseudouridine55 synthase
MDGYLLVGKPEGISSFGIVAKVRRVIREATGQKIKIGHTGTLDPMASGLMILVLGKYTKKAALFSKLDKVYEAELTLGSISSTGDREGDISQKSVQPPSESKVKQALNNFIGDITQTPPIYSAIKVGGKRAYKLAREGKEVVLQPRPAKVFSIEDIKYDYPKLLFTVHVGSGTYIRSLAEDIGEKLGTGAYLSKLVRVKVGSYSLKDAVSVEELDYPQLLKNIRSGLSKHL